MGLFTLVSGVLPQITEWHDEKTPSREVFGGVPGPLQVAFYTVDPGDVGVGRVRLRRSRAQLGARRTRSPAHDAEERQAPPGRLPRRRVHAHPAARLGRRADALDDLLRVPRAARRDDRARGRPPDAGDAKFLHGKTYLGVLVVRRPCRRRVHGRHRVGDPAPIRAAAVSHPHQDQARARGDPRHVLPDRRQRASSPRRSASPRSTNRATRSGASSAIR